MKNKQNNNDYYYDKKNIEYIKNNIANFQLIMLNLIETLKKEGINYSIVDKLNSLEKGKEKKFIKEIKQIIKERSEELEEKDYKIKKINNLKDRGYIFSLGIVDRNINDRIKRLNASYYFLNRYEGMIEKVISQYQNMINVIYYDYNINNIMDLSNAEEYFSIIKELDRKTEYDNRVKAKDITCYEDIQYLGDYDKIKLKIYKIIKDSNITVDKINIKDVIEFMMLSKNIDKKEKQDLLYYYKEIALPVEQLKIIARNYEEGVPFELREDLNKYTTFSIKEEEEIYNKIELIKEEREKGKLNSKTKRKKRKKEK